MRLGVRRGSVRLEGWMLVRKGWWFYLGVRVDSFLEGTSFEFVYLSFHHERAKVLLNDT